MNYKAEFSGWKQLSQINLIVAYRKAKSDCFYEEGFPSAIALAEFEGDLLGNLDALLNEWKHSIRGLQKLSYIPKLIKSLSILSCISPISLRVTPAVL